MNTTYWKALAGGVLTNLKGRRTKERLVIFESDDWGAIRTPSAEYVDRAREQGLEVDKSRFRVDALASESDLQRLFDLLASHRDQDGNPARFTANSIMANPSFDQIAESNFQEYFYEPFYLTFERYPEHQNNLQLWKEGIAAGVFQPQFHGREHLNYKRWLHDLRAGNPKVRFSFNWQSTYSGRADYSYMGAFDWDDPTEVENHKVAVREGLAIFAETFQFSSSSFIAPCYTWDQRLNPTLVESGINLIQGMPVQLQPVGAHGTYDKISHSYGEQDRLGLHYNVRNCVFEPVAAPNQDWVDKVMARMQAAFLLGKPAVISTHRVNFIGFIEAKNRDRGLRDLDRLLQSMLRKWPDIRFISTDQLINHLT
ncbi:MAG: hypothetical protein AAFO03_20710 [Bacteroidota bacterium]